MTIEHPFGETTIEQEPERIVTLGWNAQDIVYALVQSADADDLIDEIGRPDRQHPEFEGKTVSVLSVPGVIDQITPGLAKGAKAAER